MRNVLGVVVVLGVVAACTAPGAEQPVDAALEAPSFPCAADNGGISLPEGFCAQVFADEIGLPRHLTVADNGDVYAARRPQRRRNDAGEIVIDSPGGVVALRDTTGDGAADTVEDVNEVAGTGVGLHGGYLYYSSTTELWRVARGAGELVPAAAPELLVSGFPEQGQHASKPFTFDGAGNVYVTVGAPSNACQEQMRIPGSAGLDPCPQLELQAGIWSFDAAVPGQTQADGVRYATGIRNALALDWNAADNALYALQHGRDSLYDLWGEMYSQERSAELPAEEFVRVAPGDDFGWPFCYFDHFEGIRVLAPEYGGDGLTVGRCADFAETLIGFPAHWAPNDLLFYRGGTFPERYEGGAFIAFHGSWNRMPFAQAGYNVVFVPFSDGAPDGDYEIFAAGFPGVDEIRSPGQAAHRPTGLAQGPDGSLYIADDRGGRIWRVRALTSDESAQQNAANEEESAGDF
jgi:glucose/arabinose dehydrogenase